MRKVALHNLGCKVNACELEAMQDQLVKNGYEIVPFDEVADVYIINTCTVTNVAERKSRQMLHRARKLNPDALVAAAGCYVETEKGRLDPAVDLVIPNDRKQDVAALLAAALEERDAAQMKTNENAPEESAAPVMDEAAPETAGKTGEPGGNEHGGIEPGVKEYTRAFVKVQDGCNQFCSYCIIPYVRGRAKSRPMEEVLAKIRDLADEGYKEVVLTGIHLSSYGLDLQKEDGDHLTLLDLIRAVHEVPGISRIRLGSLEPGIVTEEFARDLAALPKVCPHFHLSLQSGCAETLRRMNRHYTPEEYAKKCAILRKYFDEPALTTDVIVGFPGETEEEFAASEAFIDSLNFYETHVFQYSRREGTKADQMPDQVPAKVKAERSHELLELSRKKQAAYETRLIGTTQEVLMEEAQEIDGETWQVGHTKSYVKVGLKTAENLENSLVQVKICDSGQILH